MGDGVRGELGGVLGVGVHAAGGGPPRGDVHDVGPGLALRSVVDAGEGEGPGLAQAAGQAAHHGVRGVAAVGHVEPAARHHLQRVLGHQLLVVDHPGTRGPDILHRRSVASSASKSCIRIASEGS